MHAVDVLRYGHSFVTRILDGLPLQDWDTPCVCGAWSTKEIVAHLASFDQVLSELLAGLLSSPAATPTLDQYRADGQAFNDDQVGRRSALSPAEVRAEYETAHAHTLELAARLPEAVLRRAGSLPWYGAEYDLEDFIVYAYYGHQREHGAQIAVFRDKIGR